MPVGPAPHIHVRQSSASLAWGTALLLAPAAALRIGERAIGRGADRAHSDLELTPSRLDAMLAWPMRAEAAWLARGHTLPAGLSLLAVARA